MIKPISRSNQKEFLDSFTILTQLRTTLTVDRFYTLLGREDYRFFSHSYENLIIGVCGLRFIETITRGHHCHIHDFVIDKNHQKHGHGSHFMTEIKKLSIENNCSWIFLDGIDSALPFYNKIGFIKHGATLLKIKPS
jgi:GNAT superfamily N-acetyltransferase